MENITDYNTENRERQFPLSVLPQQLAEVVNELHTSLNYPREYLAGSMLVAMATAMGNNWTLRVYNGWDERALLYLAIVGNAGANKTHPMRYALTPLVGIDLRRVAEAKERFPYEPPRRIVASDVTQEGLVSLHSNNPRGMVLFVDELKAWINNFSRYSSGSQEQFWLSNFSRTPILVDRKGQPEPTSIPSPMISVIGSTQPSVLRSFATGDRATNGFIDRMLFVVKEGANKAYWSDRQSEGDMGEYWRGVVEMMVEDETEYMCHFSEEAREVASGWQVHNADIVNSCHNEMLVGVYSKLEIYFVRLCLLLHALHYRCYNGIDPSVVSADVVRKAVGLVEYFRGEADVAQRYLYPDEEAELNEREMKLYHALPDYFSRKEAVRIATSMGISRANAYRYVKSLTGGYIEINEAGEYYKLEA